MTVSGRVADEVDKRLAERLGAAGLPQSQIALQVLYLLPREFVDAYSALYHRALRVAGDTGRPPSEGRTNMVDDGKGGVKEEVVGVGPRVSGARKSKLSEGSTLGGMAGAKKGKAYKRAWVVADEIALEKKIGVDKRLRKIARELRALVDAGEDSGVGDERKKCSGKKCGKFLEMGWKYCPSCGARQRSGDGEG